MLLGNKKNQKKDQNWCIILSPITSEIDKKQVAQSISQVFSLTAEESTDLVNSTPIILLDNLTREVAGQVKEYFRPCGAEMVLTNDTFLKRKCYRTVWPTPPNLSFLHDWKPKTPPQKPQEEQVLQPEEALNELRSLAEMSKQGKEAEQEPLAAVGQSAGRNGKETAEEEMLSRQIDRDEEELARELQKWKHESVLLRDQVNRLQSETTQLRKRLHLETSQVRSDREEIVRDQQGKLQETRALLINMEEKYEVLKEEYQQARAILESKVVSTEKEVNQKRDFWQGRIQELEQTLNSWKQERDQLEEMIRTKENELGSSHDALKKTKDMLKQAEHLTQDELAKWQNKTQDLAETTESLRKENHSLTEILQDKETQLRQLHEECNQLRRLLQDRMEQESKENQKSNSSVQQLKQENEELKVAFDQVRKVFEDSKQRNETMEMLLTQKVKDYEQSELNWRKALEEQEAKSRSLQQQFEVLYRQLDELKSQNQQYQDVQENAASRQKDLEKNQYRLLQELDSRTRLVQEWETRGKMWETKASELHAAYQKQQTILDETFKMLDVREKDLTEMRRKIQALQERLEGSTGLAQREFLVRHLTDKEKNLKQLVGRQEKIESEIRDREAEMRGILSEQEGVEKEIIECKQVLRRLPEHDKPLNPQSTPDKLKR